MSVLLRDYKSIACDSAPEVIMVGILFFFLRAICYWSVDVFFRLFLSFLSCLFFLREFLFKR